MSDGNHCKPNLKQSRVLYRHFLVVVAILNCFFLFLFLVLLLILQQTMFRIIGISFAWTPQLGLEEEEAAN